MTPVIESKGGLTIYKPDVRVYVAGPYTIPDKVQNARIAIMAGNALAELGFKPFIPHLSLLWEIVCPQNYRFWLDYDLNWLALCDAVLRLPGDSMGADEETSEALAKGIPVFDSISELVAWEFGSRPKKKAKRSKA